jgi:phosphonate ABC transporter substrate-binding protein
MTYQFAISPDVHARELTTWFILNTRLQRLTGQAFHATAYDDFGEMHRAYDEGRVDLIFANAADTARLVRQGGFIPVARPASVSDEALVAVAADGPVESLDDFGSSLRVAATDAPDVERICRILLEPADLTPETISLTIKRNYVLVAKALLTGEAEAGFFLRDAYDQMSEMTRRRLRPVISSKIYVVRHCLLASPALAGLVEPIRAGLAAMSDNPADADLLAGLGAPGGWESVTAEEVEFMIDLMDALAQQ